ncbi:MAG: replicative DNA helicase [Bacteroidales bacterium]|nr:replicative DNA helicase [Bacteroidales bacterium]
MAIESKPQRRKKDDVDFESLGAELGNTPPQALDAEEGVLGAMLLEPSCVEAALGELSPACFYDPRNRMIFEAITLLDYEHSPIDKITVTGKLRQQKKLEEVGGTITLVNLSEKVGSAAHVEYYIKILKQKTIQRDLIKASYEILKDSYDESANVDELIDKAQTKVYDAVQNNIKRDVRDIGSIISEAMEDIGRMQSIEGLSGVPSGFSKVDAITSGWQPSDLIILAARPSVGKTAFALNLARNAAVDHHIPVAFFSLEMSSIQLVKRLMTTESGLSADKIKGSAKLHGDEWDQLNLRLKPLAKAPLYIDDTPGLHIMEFRAKAKNLVKQKNVKLIVVDYLQLMQGPVEMRGLREQEVAAVSRTLKATAKELDVPIIALSQLSRQSVQREGAKGKPQLSDLRESGSIEQDADMVIFIHRPDYVGMSDSLEDRERSQILIAKHRNGETGEIDMRFRSDQVRFIEEDDALNIQASRVESRMNSEDFGPDESFQ